LLDVVVVLNEAVVCVVEVAVVVDVVLHFGFRGGHFAPDGAAVCRPPASPRTPTTIRMSGVRT
jgi:hypothetical protein